MINWTKIADVTERSMATFAQVFIAVQITDASQVTQLSNLKTAAVAAGIAVGKYVLVQLNAFLGSPAQVSLARFGGGEQ